MEKPQVCDGLMIKNDRKGAICQVEGETLIFKGFPFSTEITDEEAESFLDGFDLTQYEIFECLEGTIIRVFFYNDKFWTTTSKRLDAFKSKWASIRTYFGQSFAQQLRKLVDWSVDDDREFLKMFYEKYLDKKKRYCFILRSSEEERIVCDANLIPGVTYLCNETDSHVMDFSDQIQLDDTFFPKSKRISGLETGQQAAEYVRNHTHFTVSQGIILFKQNGENLESIKIMSKEYAVRFNLRGNESSLKFRYLQLRQTSYDLDLFFEMYPQIRSKAKQIEENIWKICQKLHDLYVKYYIRNESVSLQKEEMRALKTIHDTYRETREKTTATRINDILTSQPATCLNKLIKEQFEKC